MPLPLNIKDFAFATQNTTNKSKLIDIINSKSQETVISFASEIEMMTLDKVLSLLFPFISGSFSFDFVRIKYQELIRELKLQGEWTFEQIIDWFRDDKIDLRYRIKFSHPSYSEALWYLINRSGSKISDLLYEVLARLAEDNYAAIDIARLVEDNFDRLPENVRNLLLFKLSNGVYARYIVEILISNFDRLPENVQSLLFKLADNKDASGAVASAVISNFDRLPENVRNKAMLKIMENKDASGAVTKLIRIVFLPANPFDPQRLILIDEFNDIDSKLRVTNDRDKFDLIQRHTVSISGLQEILQRYDPQIVHFSGRGSNTGALIFENPDGEPKEVSPDVLISSFKRFSGNIRCVVLDACYCEKQAIAITKAVDTVVGVPDSISDTAAREFLVSFYQALGHDLKEILIHHNIFNLLSEKYNGLDITATQEQDKIIKLCQE